MSAQEAATLLPWVLLTVASVPPQGGRKHLSGCRRAPAENVLRVPLQHDDGAAAITPPEHVVTLAQSDLHSSFVAVTKMVNQPTSPWGASMRRCVAGTGVDIEAEEMIQNPVTAAQEEW